MHWSFDSFLDGGLKVCQSRYGYRFSVDAAILAFHAIPDKPDARILDLGTGCGIMPLVTALRYPDVHITGVEIQAELAALARNNVEENGFLSRITIVEGDFLRLRSNDIGPPVDMVITNPPYRRPHSGRVSPQNQRAVARHEIAVSLDGLIKTMRRFLSNGGRGWIIYPVERLAELMAGMQAYGLEPKFLKMIHPRIGLDAKRCLLKVVKGGRSGLIAGPPLVIYNADGGYSDDMRAILRP